MSGNGILNSKAAVYGVLAVVGVAAIYFFGRKLLNAAGSGISSAASAVGTAINPVDPNNLAYRGVNGVGASISGDNSWSLGGWIYDLTHPAYDPNAAIPDTNTPNVGRATISNPVTPTPAVLPYSYRQAVVDTPALLGTDALFTPSYGGGSSGDWAESGVPGNAGQNPYAQAPTSNAYPSLILQ